MGEFLPFLSSSKTLETAGLPRAAQKRSNEWNFALLSELRWNEDQKEGEAGAYDRQRQRKARVI